MNYISSQAQIPLPDTAQAKGFLDHMYPNEPRHLVAISDHGIQAKSFHPDQSAELAQWIECRQGKYNIYYHVNRLFPDKCNIKAKKTDVFEALFLHVDIDDISGLERLSTFEPKPTTVIFSGGGYQAFWRLNEAANDLDAVERCASGISMRSLPQI